MSTPTSRSRPPFKVQLFRPFYSSNFAQGSGSSRRNCPNLVGRSTQETGKCGPPGDVPLNPRPLPDRTASPILHRPLDLSHSLLRVPCFFFFYWGGGRSVGFYGGSLFSLALKILPPDPPFFLPFPMTDCFHFVCASDRFLEQSLDFFSAIQWWQDRLLVAGKNSGARFARHCIGMASFLRICVIFSDCCALRLYYGRCC